MGSEAQQQLGSRSVHMMTLRERIAQALGWTVADVSAFSLHTLREMLAEHPKLKHEVTVLITTGDYLRQGLQ